MTTLHLKVKAETSGAAWEVTCKEAAITVINEKLEDGLIELLEKVKTSLVEEIDTTKRIVTRLEDLTATAVITVRFYSDQDLDAFTEAPKEETKTPPLLEGQQMCLPAGEGEAGEYPITAECIEAGCKKIKSVRADLSICEITGVRPENMNGKYPVGCFRHIEEPEEKPAKYVLPPEVLGADPRARHTIGVWYRVKEDGAKFEYTRFQGILYPWGNNEGEIVDPGAHVRALNWIDGSHENYIFGKIKFDKKEINLKVLEVLAHIPFKPEDTSVSQAEARCDVEAMGL